MKRLAVLGASGHGKVVADIAELNGWHVSFFDDAWPKNQQIGCWRILGTTEDLLSNVSDYLGVVVAIGNNVIRFEKSKLLQSLNIELVSLIHPRAVVSKHTLIGPGTVVMAGAVINPFAKVGLSSIINTASSIDHDCVLGDCVHISPGANLAGSVEVGALSWIGIGSVIKQGISIGKKVIVGAGAVVVKYVPDNVVVMGNPAK